MRSPSVPQDHVFIDALRRALQAELIETSISWVLLTGQEAYKLKKPVRLPFLDFRQASERCRLLHEELQLNRRWAPSLYRDVVPITGTPEAPVLAGDGPPFDHALRMWRFPTAALFSSRLALGTLTACDVERLAQRIAAFQQAADIAPNSSVFGRTDTVWRQVETLLDPLERSGADLAALSRWLCAQHRSLAGLREARRTAGHVREGHGDLHLQNLLRLEDGTCTAFDCIEFDPALRWIDVVADIAFTTMDLRARGRTDLAFWFLDRWLEESGDFAALPLLRFHEVTKALVRAVVNTGLPDRDAPDYLACARSLASEPADPRLLITCGLSASGKSTVARELLQAAGAVRVRSDVERKRLFGLRPLQSSAGQSELYGPEATRRTFERLADLARCVLQAGYPVIVDAAFLRRAERERFRAVAAEAGVPFCIVHCHAPQAELVRRAGLRAAGGDDPSEAGPAVIGLQRGYFEPLAHAERRGLLELDTSGKLDVASLWRRWRCIQP